jgi:hypothetical protein
MVRSMKRFPQHRKLDSVSSLSNLEYLLLPLEFLWNI